MTKWTIWTALLGCCLLSSGCVCSDYAFCYRVQGQLVDANGKALGDRRMVVQRDTNWSPPTPSSPEIARTSKTGQFKNTFMTGGIVGGDTRLFGLIVIDEKKPPVPPEVNEFTLGVEVTPDNWIVQRIPVSTQQQTREAPGKRWIEVGTIAVPTADAKVPATGPAEWRRIP